MGFHIQLRVNLVKSRKKKYQNIRIKAIGSFVRKIKEKTQVSNCPGAELSWCRNVSHRCRIVRVPNCLGAEMSQTGAEVSWCRIVPVPKCLAFL